MSGFNREEARGGWRILPARELHNLYPSPNIISKSRIVDLYLLSAIYLHVVILN
jgi:hypothetical protein